MRAHGHKTLKSIHPVCFTGIESLPHPYLEGILYFKKMHEYVTIILIVCKKNRIIHPWKKFSLRVNTWSFKLPNKEEESIYKMLAVISMNIGALYRSSDMNQFFFDYDLDFDLNFLETPHRYQKFYLTRSLCFFGEA